MRGAALTGAVGALVVLAACSGTHMSTSPPDASPTQVLTAFLAASRASDKDAGRQLTGDCWNDVSSWFANTHDRLETFRVADRPMDQPTERDTETRVRFDFTDSSRQPQGRWQATLRRTGPSAPWRVCHLAPLAG